jgi:hypothetical protein
MRRYGVWFVLRGEGDLVDCHLATCSPDQEIGHVGMCVPLAINEVEALRLAPVRVDGRVAVEQQGQFPFLEGLALDRLIGLAGNRIAEVPPTAATRRTLPGGGFLFSPMYPSFSRELSPRCSFRPVCR